MAQNREFRRPRHPKFSELAHCSLDKRKVRYRDKKLAINYLHHIQNKAAAEIAQTGHTSRHENRAYQCNACKGWHLTSQQEHTLAA